MDYNEESDKALTVAVEVAETIKTLRELNEEYPHLVKVVFNLLYGVMVKASVVCPECHHSIEFKGRYPIGGLLDSCDDIEQLLYILQMEIDLEGGEKDDGDSD